MKFGSFVKEAAATAKKEADTKAADLSHLSKHGFTNYSHGPGHSGHINKDGKTAMTAKKLDSHLRKAGYKHTRVMPSSHGVGSHTYLYHKPGGKYTDHHLHVTTKNDKLWNIEHKTVTDHT